MDLRCILTSLVVRLGPWEFDFGFIISAAFNCEYLIIISGREPNSNAARYDAWRIANFIVCLKNYRRVFKKITMMLVIA